MAERLRISKQLEQSANNGSLIVSDTSNNPYYLAPIVGANKILGLVGGLPAWITNTGASGTPEDLENTLGVGNFSGIYDIVLSDVPATSYTTKISNAAGNAFINFNDLSGVLNGIYMTVDSTRSIVFTNGVKNAAFNPLDFTINNFLLANQGLKVVGNAEITNDVLISGTILANNGSAISQFLGEVYLGGSGSNLGKLIFYNSTNSNYIQIESGATVPTFPNTYIKYILPVTDPTAGQVLSATAPVANVSTLSWATASSGASGLPANLAIDNTTDNGGTVYDIILSDNGSGTESTRIKDWFSGNSYLEFTKTIGSKAVLVGDTGVLIQSTSSGIELSPATQLVVYSLNNLFTTGAYSFLTADTGIAEWTGSDFILGEDSTTNGKITFYNSTNSNTISFQSGLSGGNLTFTLPTSYSLGGQALVDNGAGVLSWASIGAGTVTSVSGTANRITSTGGATPIINIDSAYDALWQPTDADLTAIAALGFTTTAFLKKTAINTWALDTTIYLSTAPILKDVLNAGNFSEGSNIILGSTGVSGYGDYLMSENSLATIQFYDDNATNGWIELRAKKTLFLATDTGNTSYINFTNDEIQLSTNDGVTTKTIILNGADLKFGGLAVSASGNDKMLVVDSVTEEVGYRTIPSSGITRSIITPGSSLTMGATALTDYVYLVGAVYTMTLPTAVGNTNQYTVKNNHSVNITVNTTSSQTMDGSTTITLTPNTALTFISNNSNWSII